MRSIIIFILTDIQLFIALSTYAADKVVVIPLGENPPVRIYYVR